jgi:hypothetical protein
LSRSPCRISAGTRSDGAMRDPSSLTLANVVGASTPGSVARKSALAARTASVGSPGVKPAVGRRRRSATSRPGTPGQRRRPPAVPPATAAARFAAQPGAADGPATPRTQSPPPLVLIRSSTLLRVLTPPGDHEAARRGMLLLGPDLAAIAGPPI